MPNRKELSANMQTYYMDLHIHIGRTMHGDPVKITASDQLTLTNIVEEAAYRKGLQLIGVIDGQVPAVQSEVIQLIERGQAEELEDGGVQYGPLTLLLGSEIEVYDEHCQGPIHVLCYFPYIETMQQFTVWLSERMKNINLSSQRYYGSAIELQQKVRELGGIFVPAHMFTPFKSLYGKGVKQSLEEVLNPELIDAVELGLSADSRMADSLSQLHDFTFLSNSDAHSTPKIAREYQSVQLQAPTFEELRLALQKKAGRKVLANYGMNPLLGKYHQTVCADCLSEKEFNEECPECGSMKSVRGVADRIEELSDFEGTREGRPPYVYQIPLEYIPKLGPKTLQKLLDVFGTEMSILHDATLEELREVLPKQLAERIVMNRKGKLSIEAGGGGRYGRVT